MAKLNFPGVGMPYRGFISEMRTWFQIIASKAEASPGNAASINSHIAVLAAATGYAPDPDPLPSNQAVVEDEDVFTDGDYEVTINVTDGVITVSVVDTSE